jgi:beta-lactamase class A
MLISRLGEKYSFNREINDDRIKKEKIMLPVNAQNEPDYEYMKQYMRNKKQESLLQYLEYRKKGI